MTPYRHQSRTMLIGACIVIVVIAGAYAAHWLMGWRLPW